MLILVHNFGLLTGQTLDGAVEDLKTLDYTLSPATHSVMGTTHSSKEKPCNGTSLTYTLDRKPR